MTETATATNKARNKQQTYKPQYDLSDFKEFRKNEESFDAFVKYFLKKTYTKEWDNKRWESTTKLSDIMTVSDEAFVYLVLENNWERWLDINDRSKNKCVPSRRDASDRINSNILPKYTNINGHPSYEGGKVGRGWSHAGIERFNEICNILIKDRRQNANVEKKLLAAIRSEMMETKRAKKRRRKATPPPKAYVDYGEISEEDSSESEQEGE